MFLKLHEAAHGSSKGKFRSHDELYSGLNKTGASGLVGSCDVSQRPESGISLMSTDVAVSLQDALRYTSPAHRRHFIAFVAHPWSFSHSCPMTLCLYDVTSV